MVAAELDLRDRRGLLRAFVLGEAWACEELADLGYVETFYSLFMALEKQRGGVESAALAALFA